MSKHYGQTDNLFDIDPENVELVRATAAARREQMEIHRRWEKMEGAVMALGDALERRGAGPGDAEVRRLKGEMSKLRDEIGEREKKHAELAFRMGALKTIHHGPPGLREGAKIALKRFESGDRSFLPPGFGGNAEAEDPLERPNLAQLAREGEGKKDG